MSWEGGNAACRELYPAPLGRCECEDACGEDAVERHHINGDPDDNRRENVRFLTRRCHMAADGRLAAFVGTSASARGPQPPKPCGNCGRPSKPLRRGRCHTCNEYRRKYGVERPYVHDGRRERATT